MARITGIGGVFLKCKGDSAALASWYQKNLGMQLEDFGGAVLQWPDDKAEDLGLTVCHLAGKGVAVVAGPESHENGKFAWIMDPDGNKVELWQPMAWDNKNKVR